jgi:hypothetical protein
MDDRFFRHFRRERRLERMGLIGQNASRQSPIAPTYRNAVQGILRKLPHLVPEFRIFVVQPGLSRARAITSQLELLAVTEAYLQETFGIAMTVYASP